MRSLRFLLISQLVMGLAATVVLTSSALISKQAVTREAGRALMAKDVTADMLPPPMYLIELRLVLSTRASLSVNRRCVVPFELAQPRTGQGRAQRGEANP